MRIAGPAVGIAMHCAPILRGLPEWFGREDALVHYLAAIDELPTFIAHVDGELAGFLTLKQHNPYAAEIYVMGVAAHFHRRGYGRKLLDAAEKHLQQQGVEYLQVKTLGPSHPDRHYAATRAFYQAMDFRPLEEFRTLWDEANPCLLLVKRLT